MTDFICPGCGSEWGDGHIWGCDWLREQHDAHLDRLDDMRKEG
jgi:hypothetical protein